MNTRLLSILLIVVGAGAVGLLAQDDVYTTRRQGMVALQIRSRGVKDKTVLEAMSTVPRHRFVLPGYLARAYEDSPLPIGQGQTISQPYIVARMTELLEPKPEHKMLEIGTGSGYQAAVLAELVKEVYTVEIIKSLGNSAKKRLAELGYENVTVKVADGYHGWEEHAPFDGIIVTAAATEIPPPLIEQLKPSGRMVIPVGNPDQTQWLKLLVKDAEGTPTVRNISQVRFVPFTGDH